jgi:hypothetical protein
VILVRLALQDRLGQQGALIKLQPRSRPPCQGLGGSPDRRVRGANPVHQDPWDLQGLKVHRARKESLGHLGLRA